MDVDFLSVDADSATGGDEDVAVLEGIIEVRQALIREVYTPSGRPYQGLPDLDYPFHDRDVLVTACGRICIYRKKINVSTVLAGQRLGIKEVDEGIWLVSFIDYDLGYIDLEQRTLQPVDNPFGPRLSPMS